MSAEKNETDELIQIIKDKSMSGLSIGNELNGILYKTIGDFFESGRLFQLSYSAFEETANRYKNGTQETLKLTYPVGLDPHGNQIFSNKDYSREDLFKQYERLAGVELPITGIYSLVTRMEIMLADLIKALILKYPKKLSGKKTMPLEKILACESIESVRICAADSLINDLLYKSPKDFAESVKDIINVNLLEMPQYHKYIEVKATRDIYIHNQGVANDIYITKAGSQARAKSGDMLPINISYFLASYETCIQLAENLEKELHENWNSDQYEERVKRNAEDKKLEADK